MKRIFVLGLGFILGFGIFGPAAALDFLESKYDPAIPTLKAVIGHNSGEVITKSEDALQYLDALQKAAPERMLIKPYATSWQGRDLVYAIIASPETLTNLTDVKENLAKIASGKTSGLSALTTITPAVTWLSYGVHGDEISSTDAALALAYHLLAAQNDESVDEIFRNTVVIIDPMQNPDGRARFTHSFESSLGLEAQADRYTAEHDQVWPRGRFNHYLFDLNRDWFNLSQPETKGKIKAILEWNPVVLVDAHEMGGDNTYFFAPAAEPFNPSITQAQKDKQVLIGRNHAQWFDKMGIEFFTRQVYDQFYPGYGDMWPTLNGAIAMTYEQASARGLKFTRRNGEELSYRDGVRNHFIATLSTAEVVAKNKNKFLGDFARYRTSAITEGQTSAGRFHIINRQSKNWTATRLAQRLQDQGIEVFEFEAGKNICGDTYADGAFVIDQAQPNGRLVKTLLSADTKLPDDFVTRQEKRRAQGLPHELYDVTAWSLPLMDGLEAKTCRTVDLSLGKPFSASSEKSEIVFNAPEFGFAVPWTDAGQAKLVLAALSEGLEGKATQEAFTIGKQRFGKGTAIFPNSFNEVAKQERLFDLAQEIGAQLIPLANSWVDSGPNFGSSDFKYLKTPKVAMAWGEGTSPTEAGATRFIIERELGHPVSPIRVRTLSRAELGLYDVLILPEDSRSFSQELGSRGADAIKDFVSEGGVLIALGSAVDLLIDKDMKLLSTVSETATQTEEPSGEIKDAKDIDDDSTKTAGINLDSRLDYDALISDEDRRPDSVPGVLVNTEANSSHWLSSGYDSAIALYEGRRIYRPLNKADGDNVFHFTSADTLLASGYLWEENRKQLAYKPFVMVEPTGDGMVIAITQSPSTRAYLNGLTLLMANGIVLGPAQVR